MRGSAAVRTSVVPGGVLAGPWVRNELWRRARAVPSLDLRFADNKSLTDAVTGQSLITFTRASSGTFVNSAGVIQTAVTNLLLRSEEFDNASWNSSAGARTVTANNQIAPDGTTTADTITADGTSAAHFVSQSATLSVVPYAYSVFAKAGTNNFLQLRVFNLFGGMFANFDLATGVVGTVGTVTGSTPTSSIQAYANGWYRCTMVFTATTATTSSIAAYIVDSASATGGAPNSLSTSLFLWGAQLEQSSTVGEYIPTTSTINSAPRFDHNPTTGESLGLLVEEQRTNIALQSNGFDTSWTNTESVETANQATAPDGTNSGWKLVNTAVSQSHNIFQSVAWTAVTTTVSVFVKYLDHRWVGIRMGAAGNQFFGSWDLQNSVVGSATAGATIGMQAFGNGWYRLTLTATLTLAGGANLIIGLNNADAVALTTYTGTGTGIYIFGAQIETGAFPTSYIPTTTATATRSADVASITGTAFSSWYRQDEGTVFVNAINPAVSTTLYAASDGTANNRIQADTGTNIRIARVVTGGTTQANNTIAYTFGAQQQFALSYVLNSINFANAGTLGTEDTSATIPTVDQLRIGANPTGANALNSTIRRLTYWPTRLANNTLQEVTR